MLERGGTDLWFLMVSLRTAACSVHFGRHTTPTCRQETVLQQMILRRRAQCQEEGTLLCCGLFWFLMTQQQGLASRWWESQKPWLQTDFVTDLLPNTEKVIFSFVSHSSFLFQVWGCVPFGTLSSSNSVLWEAYLFFKMQLLSLTTKGFWEGERKGFS